MAGRLVATPPVWSPFPLRLALGAVMFAHGAQKIFGAWGGKGFNAWLASPAPFDLQPAWAWMAAAAFSEFLGGALVLIGLFTRIGAFLISCVMFVAIFGVHWSRGFFINSGGFEFPLVLLAMAISLIITGGGNASIDSQMG
ncbi:MAG: DoxX family protein [Blastocatellia bacterium]